MFPSNHKNGDIFAIVSSYFFLRCLPDFFGACSSSSSVSSRAKFASQISR